MIEYPIKRVFGLIGSPRSGKDSVANYLQESRNFEALAFADKIKEECGITVADFEMAKVSGDIAKVRKKLWEFSASVREKDPDYFIRLVMEEAKNSENSVVITDIRTEDEFNALFSDLDIKPKVYFVHRGGILNSFTDDGILKESKLSMDFINLGIQQNKIEVIPNYKEGLYQFHKHLEYFFFKEDIMDLIGPTDSSDGDEHKRNISNQRTVVSNYISQFEVREKV